MAWLQPWAGWLQGDLAGVPRDYQSHVLDWQEQRTRRAVLGVMTLFVVVAALKSALVLSGVWPVESPGWTYLALTLAMAVATAAYVRARSTPVQAGVATVFLAALVLLAFGPLGTLQGRMHHGEIGLLLILPLIGLPLLVLLRSALVLAFACALLTGWFLWHSGWPPDGKLGFAVNMGVAIFGGMMLRVFRANMSIDFLRSMETAIREATTDSLTGLMNRPGWFRAAEDALRRLKAGGQPATLVFIDLDDFKKLNDTHGHAVGDEALRRTGHALAARLGAGALAGRIGGEEFVCLLPDMQPAQARRLIDRVRADLAVGTLPVTFSAGEAELRPEDDMQTLMTRADSAMYAIKHQRREQAH